MSKPWMLKMLSEPEIEPIELRLSRLIAQAESALADIQEAITDGMTVRGVRREFSPRIVLRSYDDEIAVTIHSLEMIVTILSRLPILDGAREEGE